jgi:MmyB-like transcription regulator ligand binding domain
VAHGRGGGRGGGDDPEAQELVDRLLAESPEFTELWARHEVAGRIQFLKRFLHPVVGTLTLDCQILTAENLTEKVVVFSAVPGSQDAERLKLLAVVGAQTFSGAATL